MPLFHWFVAAYRVGEFVCESAAVRPAWKPLPDADLLLVVEVIAFAAAGVLGDGDAEGFQFFNGDGLWLLSFRVCSHVLCQPLPSGVG
ncbi:hypothetical protein CCHOA_08240 [Corynebacterium choanae]|uniref:Uncharacterized protein n=1 Tax=Corynebacterium choanae TaxID=1862358 RepID=A0A3G6J810_9CORY|nr:hypothetical protein CCHOA_08240 [Corynebacterium choanae]